LVPRESPRF